MKLSCFRHVATTAIICICSFVLVAGAKEIRLRNETIKTGRENKAKALASVSLPAQGGLILLQFSQPPGPELRQQLKENGIQLLHPVPEDAFIAHIRKVKVSTKNALSPLQWLASLPQVEWIGPYTASHKIRTDLANARNQPKAEPEVAVLVAPGTEAAEVADVRKVFSRIDSESTVSPGTILKGILRPGQLDQLAESGVVLWIEPKRPMKLLDEPASKLVAGDAGQNLLLTQSLGYDGRGVKVAVADSGLNNGDAETMHPDLLGRTPAFFYYGQLEDAADEHSHGTHVAGIIAGNGATSEVDENGLLYGLGVAPGASIIAQRIFDGVGNYEQPPSSERLTRDATRAGADVGSNSWGDDTQGEYDVSAMEFDALVRDADALTPGDQQYILEFSAGNAGPVERSIGSPAVAKNVIATGACESDRTEFLIYGDGPETMADFSSRGPCKDGRIKPDVVAPGTYIASLQSQSATDEYAWAPISPNYQYQGGTSQAGPHVSGAAAVFVQYYRETRGVTPSPALVKAALINSAVDLDDASGTAAVPNMDEGWGRVDLPTLFDESLDFEYVNQEITLTNSQVYEKRIVVSTDAQPLKVTLAYTDVPGMPGVGIALVNDLDLEVVAPDGAVYRGNQFQLGESVPNAASSDAINNVEGVLIWSPMAGEHIIRIRARNVVADARQDTDPIDQDFALVISTSLVPPGHAQLIFDRQAYRSPDTIRIFLADSDLAGQASAAIRISSGTEPSGETLLLSANGNGGAFTGAVATATGPAQADGKLQIAHGDTITATYQDVSPGAVRTCSALADLVPPVLTSVASSVEFGGPVISWTSSELADSTVYFGTNATTSMLATDADLVSSHAVSLGSLLRDVPYYYYVVSADAAGNRSTNNNGGALFSFIVPANGRILLVDSWEDNWLTLGAPPLTGYTAALDQLGVPYEVWDASARGSPTNVLGNYPAVIWRLPELSDGWNSTERAAVSNYLHTGGALLVASMEVLSRIEEAGDTGFVSNVLQVASFAVDAGVGEVIGEPSDSLMAGIEISLDYQVYDDLWGGFVPSDISDTISPGPNASTLLRDAFDDAVGLRWPAAGRDAPGRLVLLSFPLDAVPEADRPSLLGKILSFLAPGSSPEAVLTFSASAYQVPGRAKIDLGDSDLAGTASVSVNVHSGSQPNGVTVQLNKSGGQAEFTGYVDIVSGAAGPGQITATNGDTLIAQYFDATVGSNLTASARVDVVSPSISGVSAEADFLDAVVYWDTDEPADSLVMFGESALLGRNAYSSTLSSAHAITLSGLSPDRFYFFKILSRDAAGNIKEDDNAGALYSFRTLKPLTAPWADNMDTGATNWSTYADPEVGGWSAAALDWTLGVPDNSIATQAHTAPNCWGTNLRGDQMDSAEMMLISPAVFLPAGTSATLRFWHNYEFTDYSGYDFELAAVQISANNGELQDLVSFMDSSYGWTEETVDLTPYAGKMIYLVWHYMLLGFEGGDRPGWLVDDVSITTSSYSAGMVCVTNNLWQADYVLSGPVFRHGKGNLVVSNAPPGVYYLEFAPVPYYTTPPSQTNSLASGATLVLYGNYTFADANNNGISDAWETAFFGTVDPNRTRQTDSDGDSMPDYAEFVVGTDPTTGGTSSTGSPGALRLALERLDGGATRLTWNSPNGCGFLVEASTNLVDWTPVSEWIRATARTTTCTLPGPGSSRMYYRLRAAP